MGTSDHAVNALPAEAAETIGHRKRSWIMLGCAWLLGFAMYVPVLCIPPIAHIIKRDLDVTHAAVGLLFSLPFSVLVLLAAPAGILADRLGTRKAVGIGAAVMAAGSLLRGTISSFDTLLLYTSIYGVGFSIVYPNLPKLVGLWFPREKVGVVTGIYATGITIGGTITMAITLPLIFPMTHTVQGTFVLWSIPALVAALLWWIVARDAPPQVEPAASVQNANHCHASSAPLWRNQNVWLIALLLFFNNVHFYTWSAWSPALFMMKGASPDLAAFMASSRGWTSIPAIFFMPWASYKIGLRKPFMWGSALLLACASCAAIYLPLPFGWPLMFIMGITTSGTFSMILALPLEMLPGRSVGAASGVVLSIGYIGGLAGPWLAGRILDATASLDQALVMLTVSGILWAFVGCIVPETGSRAKA